MENHDVVLVSAPNMAGEQFMKLLMQKRIPFAAIVNNKSEFERISKIGVEIIIVVNTTDEKTWVIPEVPVGKVFLFERSLNLCCRYLQICRSWTAKPIYVITGNQNPRLVYKGLGADFVIHSNALDYSFLITDDLAAHH